MTMVRRSLLQDVSMSELYTMADSGMTRYEIAERLGVSYSTILKYLKGYPVTDGRGKHRTKKNDSGENTNPSDVIHFCAMAPTIPSVQKKEEEPRVRPSERPDHAFLKRLPTEAPSSAPVTFEDHLNAMRLSPPSLDLKGVEIHYKGGLTDYTVNTNERTVTMQSDLINGYLDYDSLYPFITELKAIADMLGLPISVKF